MEEIFIAEAWQWRLKVLVSCQFAIGCIIYNLLSSYNRKHEKAMDIARKSAGSTSGSLFELPAFRGKTFDNPFENTRWSLSSYETFRLSIVAVTLFPLRFLGFLITLFGTCLAVLLLQKLGLKSVARLAVSLGGRFLLFCFGYHWISVKGKRAKQGVGVLLSNHCSFLDGLVFVTFTNARPLAEKANFTNPVMRVFAESIEAVLFSREDKADRQGALNAVMNGAAEAFEGTKGPVLVFPTGTTTNMQTVISFKAGAFSAGLPVQPAVLHYKFNHCDPAWVSAGPGTLMLIFRMMSQWYNRLDIEYLDVHQPTEEEKKDAHAFARVVQLKVAEAMKATVTAHASEDTALQFSAMKLNLPASVGVVGFGALKEVFSVDVKTVRGQMQVFKVLDKDGDGLISFDDFKDGFAKAFHHTSEEQTKLLHAFFFQLTGGGSHLDFRKFLIGLALVNEDQKASSTEETSTSLDPEIYSSQHSIYAKMAFAAFAKEKDGLISKHEFTELWTWLHPAGISEEMAEMLGIPGPNERRSWFKSRTKSKGSLPSSPNSPSSEPEDATVTAGKVFNLLSGGKKEETVTWNQFEAYAKKNPIFIKDLRQALFSRLAQVNG